MNSDGAIPKLKDFIPFFLFGGGGGASVMQNIFKKILADN